MGMPHSVSFAAITSAVRFSSKHSSGWAWMSRRTAAMVAACVTTESRMFMAGLSCCESASLAGRAVSRRGHIRENCVMEVTSTALSPRSLDLARTLVRMKTVSDHSNLELIHFARDELARLGVASRLTYNHDSSKANLFATLGEGKPAGLILSGHTDTVPWDGQEWTHDPLGAVVQDGKLYGRGSADMKSFIAIALAHAQVFLDSAAPFAIHFAFSYDEEVGCFGVKELIADMRDAGVRPLACIVGEPTGMVPAIAHKGVYRYRCCVRGKEAHSSLTPRSVNAVEMAAQVVCKLRAMADR